MPTSMACHFSPKVWATQPETRGATPSHRKPMMAANSKVLSGVGTVVKYQKKPRDRSV